MSALSLRNTDRYCLPPLVLATILVCLLASPTAADFWPPFSNKRVVSPDGRRYAIIREKRKGRGITFELCARRKGAPPIASVEMPGGFPRPKTRVVSIDRDPGDKLLASGTVSHLPVKVHVLNRGGILLFDTYYATGYGTIVTYLDEQGRVRAQKKLVEIFGAIPSGASFSISSIHWDHRHWVNQKSRALIVESVCGEVREIGLEDGVVSAPKAERIADLCGAGPTKQRAIALEIAARVAQDSQAIQSLMMSFFRSNRHRVVVGAAERIVSNTDEPLALRLRAAMILQAAGRPEDHRALFLSATKAENQTEDRDYATAHLADIMGMDAIPRLRELLRDRKDRVAWCRSILAFKRLGRNAVPALIEILSDRTTTPDARRGAASALSEIGSREAVPALLRAAAVPGDPAADAAVRAVTRIGTPNLAAELIRILESGSAANFGIARYFRDHPCRDALAALEKAASRQDLRDVDRYALQKAIEKCRDLY